MHVGWRSVGGGGGGGYCISILASYTNLKWYMKY